MTNTTKQDALGLLLERAGVNLLTNPAAPATQDVTVTAQEYTLSFYGGGTVALSGAHTATVTGNAIERSVLTFAPSAGTLTLTINGSVTYANLETGSFATSPMTTARSTELLTSSGANFADWYNPIEGTIVVEFAPLATGHANLGLFEFSDGTFDDAIGAFINTSNEVRCVVRNGGAVTDTLVVGTVNAGLNRLAFSFANGSFLASLNGSIPVSSSIGQLPAMSEFRLSRWGVMNGLEGHWYFVQYYPSTVPAIELYQATA